MLAYTFRTTVHFLNMGSSFYELRLKGTRTINRTGQINTAQSEDRSMTISQHKRLASLAHVGLSGRITARCY